MSSLCSACSDPADTPPVALHIVNAASAMPGVRVRDHSGCPVTPRAEAAHARMLEALCGDAWVRMRLEGAGFDAAAREMDEKACVCRSLDATSTSGFQPAANDASRCGGWTHAGP